MPAQMNMKTHDKVEYSGLPSPRRTLPYLLKASARQAMTQPKTKIWTSEPKERVDQSKSWVAVAAAYAGQRTMAMTVTSTAVSVQTVRNPSRRGVDVFKWISSDASWRMVLCGGTCLPGAVGAAFFSCFV
ncbi:protein of unknown function (plasmid) [Cupriavidus taiwanensis]|uniref:Uncharacterized protein n=1 Tax=Cupriavidus taiwanensis TaxID=164546 RepID=A0A375II51_9BURK|nr:protein of unknown function [Cupriavidus taiwanensis]